MWWSWHSTACELCVGSTDGIGEELLAADNGHGRVLGEPLRGGGVRGDEDAADPGSEHVDRAQGVLQFVDLPEAGFVVIALAEDHARLLGAAGRDVLRRAAVHPGEHQIDVEADVAGVVREHVLDGGPGVAVPFNGAADGVLE